jgi:hypothetical protein
MGRLAPALGAIALLWIIASHEFVYVPAMPAMTRAPTIASRPEATRVPYARPPSAKTSYEFKSGVIVANNLKVMPLATARDPLEYEDEVAEDEAIVAGDHTPEQRAWRIAWSGEHEDESWTNNVGEELRAKTKALAYGNVELSALSCRETVCRMELKFADQLDAQAFVSAPHDPGVQYEYQSMDPDFDGAGFDKSDYAYELLIKRPAPDYLPAASVDIGSADKALRTAEERIGRESHTAELVVLTADLSKGK